MSKKLRSKGVAFAQSCGRYAALMLQSLRKPVFLCLHHQHCVVVGIPMALTPLLPDSLDPHPSNICALRAFGVTPQLTLRKKSFFNMMLFSC